MEDEGAAVMTNALPANCDTCGPTTLPSFVTLTEGSSIEVSESSGVCPKCGGAAHITDGTYTLRRGKVVRV